AFADGSSVAARPVAEHRVPTRTRVVDAVPGDGRAHDRRHTATSADVASVKADTATAAPVSGRFRVLTTGSGGRPYTSGSSSNRKNAPAPPTPSSGSSPDKRGSRTPSAFKPSSPH